MGSKQGRNRGRRVKVDTVLPSPVIGTGERTPETGQGDSSWTSPRGAQGDPGTGTGFQEGPGQVCEVQLREFGLNLAVVPALAILLK